MRMQHKQHQKNPKLKPRQLLTRKEGVTLIEIIISLAIFGILMTLFTTLMGVATQMRRNVFAQNRTSMKLVKELAEDYDEGEPGRSMEFEFNGKKITIPGKLKTKQEGNVTYYVFDPDD